VAIVEDEGLVLRSLRFRDTSRIVVILGRRYGKVHLLAKGARDPKSPFGASLEPLTRAQIVFYLKKERELHLLRSAAVLDPQLGLLSHPRAYHLASAAAEFALKVMPDEDPAPEIYDVLCDFLARQALRPPAEEDDGGLKSLQLRMIALLGYAPQLHTCVHCGEPVDAPRGFDVAEGGILCARCTPQGERLPLGREALLRLRQLAAPADVNSSTAAPGTIPPQASRECEREMGRVIEAFLRYHLPSYPGLRSLKSLAEWTRVHSRPRPPQR
jgi:DNA repair protein RecO (recombination protein O)